MLQDKLKELVQTKALTQSEADVLTLQLTPQQTRFFLHLAEQKTSNTITISSSLSIGNCSDVAASINKKLKNHHDERRIICTMKQHTNQFKQTGQIGWWSILVDAASNDTTI